MPFITPEDLVNYTVIDFVKKRNTQLLVQDILEAEAEIKIYCGHDFSDKEKYPVLPEEVKIASKKLSQYYSLINADEATLKALSSEKIGDYSYQKGTLSKPDVSHLLLPYKTGSSIMGEGNVSLKLRLI